ncbi:MAG: chorismate lyase [Moraxella sp.]|uniref:chorismate--pyruvate lyase family protein n=1 Tax=Moraxella sp. TaxID=479 RepID=UPI0026DCA52B|nr:chorismate lyase [Moraxella sp.]MDO4449411.1 chorismate lyase [Moraxella sp.]
MHSSVPPHLHPFLDSHGSLTALLEKRAGRPLRVQIISEGYQPLDCHTKKILGLPVHRPALAWVREVLLLGSQDRAWVKARSIFPLPTLFGQAKRLRHLRGTPIGYVIFKKNRRLPHVRTFFYDEHWGRRTVYQWREHLILIEERFLSDFCDFITPP